MKKTFKTLDELAESDVVFALAQPTANQAAADPTAELRAALSADLQPLGAALADTLQAGDLPAFQAALRQISARMPDFLASPALESLLTSQFTQALTDDES